MSYLIRKYNPETDISVDEIEVEEWDEISEHCQRDSGDLVYWKKQPGGGLIMHILRGEELIVYDVVKRQ